MSRSFKLRGSRVFISVLLVSQWGNWSKDAFHQTSPAETVGGVIKHGPRGFGFSVHAQRAKRIGLNKESGFVRGDAFYFVLLQVWEHGLHDVGFLEMLFVI